MSQPDLIAQLREARPAAPPELHERVRLIAREAGLPPRHRVTWRRAAVLALAAAAVATVAGLAFLPRDGKPSAVATTVTFSPPTPGAAEGSNIGGATPSVARRTPYLVPQTPGAARDDRATDLTSALSRRSVGAYSALKAAEQPAPSPSRIQRYTAVLDLELSTPSAVSAASKKAVTIATSLSGYQQAVSVRTTTKAGYAHIVLRVPSNNVREAIRRLSALGKITAENVAIQDLQVQVNATDTHIGRLQIQLSALVAQPQTTELDARIASVTAQIERLQRSRAATVRAAHYATIDLQLATKQAAAPKKEKESGSGPLHGLGIAFHWIWIGAVYALALGTPLIALAVAFWLVARGFRRRREDALLATQ